MKNHTTLRRSLSPVVALCVPLTFAVSTVQVATAKPVCTVVAAGDLSSPVRFVNATGSTAIKLSSDTAVLLGDIQYPSGSLRDFKTKFATTTWAKVPNLYPLPGNHDYRTPGASGYFTYFGHPAPYYARDLGCGWRGYWLNSEISFAPQATFIRKDLSAHPRDRVVAMWHKPRYSSGKHGPNTHMAALLAPFGDRLDNGVALWGHDHDYERGVTSGLSWAVCGTGGNTKRKFRTISPGSRFRLTGVPGVCRLSLTASSGKLDFIDTKGSIRDSATL